MLALLTELLNLAVDVIVIAAAIILTRRFRRSGSSALLALATGFWLLIIAIALRLAAAWVIPAPRSPDIASAYIGEALVLTVQLLTIGSFVALTYGAIIAPAPRRKYRRREPEHRS